MEVFLFRKPLKIKSVPRTLADGLYVLPARVRVKMRASVRVQKCTYYTRRENYREIWRIIFINSGARTRIIRSISLCVCVCVSVCTSRRYT